MKIYCSYRDKIRSIKKSRDAFRAKQEEKYGKDYDHSLDGYDDLIFVYYILSLAGKDIWLLARVNTLSQRKCFIKVKENPSEKLVDQYVIADILYCDSYNKNGTYDKSMVHYDQKIDIWSIYEVLPTELYTDDDLFGEYYENIS